MDCNGCGGGKTEAEAHREFGALDYSKVKVRGNTMLSVMNKKITIEQPLIHCSPVFGWNMYILVNGSVHKVSAMNEVGEHATLAADVVNSAIGIYASNGIVVPPSSVWWGANRDWIRDVSVRNREVTPEALEALSVDFVAPVFVESYPPQIWGARGWGLLQMLLVSKETYSENEFLSVCDILTRLLKDGFVGCETCHEPFRSAVDDFRSESGRSLHYARQWVFSLMNKSKEEQGKATPSWEIILQSNRWKQEAE